MLKKVHFVGIGGIGVSAIARMMILEGIEVSGSDQSSSLVTEELQKLGAKIYFTQQAKNISPDLDLVIYSIAVPADNPELARVRELRLEIKSYPEFLGELSKEKFTIAVAGTHGKTTTTAMIAAILIEAKLDPTVIVGSFLLNEDGLRTNFIASSAPLGAGGKPNYLVVEACEYKRSFLNLSPKILVITNIDNDHLDYYRDLDDIKSAFAEISAKSEKVITENDYLKLSTFNFQLLIPGVHNIKNAQAALAVAQALGISPSTSFRALNKFRGTWRRFEYKGEIPPGVALYDDYAHHPTEIRATLAGAREAFPGRRLIVLFQPHLFSRTKLLLQDFAKSFSDADVVIFAPIYAAREPVDPSISTSILAAATREYHSAVYEVASLEAAPSLIKPLLKSGDILITMGAGDIASLEI